MIVRVDTEAPAWLESNGPLSIMEPERDYAVEAVTIAPTEVRYWVQIDDLDGLAGIPSEHLRVVNHEVHPGWVFGTRHEGDVSCYRLGWPDFALRRDGVERLVDHDPEALDALDVWRSANEAKE